MVISIVTLLFTTKLNAMRLIKNIAIFLFCLSAYLSNAQINSLNFAEMCMNIGEYPQAVEHLTNYIQRHPDESIGYIKRAQAYGASGQLDLQALDLKTAQEINLVKTNMYINKDYRSKVIAKKTYNYGKSDDLFGKSPIRLTDYNKWLNSTDLGEEQMRVINNVLRSAIVYDFDAVKELTTSNSFQGIPSYLKYDMLGLYELKRGNFEKASELFNQSIADNDTYAMAYHNLGISYYLRSEMTQAIDALQSAITLDSNIPLFYYSKAKVNESINPSGALDYYEKAIELDDEYNEAMLDYSILLKSLGQFGQGSIYLNNGLRGLDNDLEKRFVKGSILLVEGDYLSAIDIFDDFLAQQPNDAEALYNRGLSHILVSNYDAGCRDLNQSSKTLTDSSRLEIINQLCSTVNNPFDN